MGAGEKILLELNLAFDNHRDQNGSQVRSSPWKMMFSFPRFPIYFSTGSAFSCSFPCLPSEGAPQSRLAMRGGRNGVRVSSECCTLRCA
jgi:hypothetical protein